MIHLEVLALATLGTLVFRFQINGTLKRCWKALHRPSNATLLLHIILSVAEVVRYYGRRYHGEYYLPYSSSNNNKLAAARDIYNTSTASLWTYSQDAYNLDVIRQHEAIRLPTANLLDLILMLIQCHTSLVLARDRVWAGHKSMLRPVYHSQTLFRILFTASSFLLSSPSLFTNITPTTTAASHFPSSILLPLLNLLSLLLNKLPTSATWRSPAQLYRASAMVNASFVYPRLLVWALCRLGGVGPLGRRYRDVYTFAIFLSAVVAMHDGGVALGPQLYIAGVGLFVVLERWVARQVLERTAGGVGVGEEGPETKKGEEGKEKLREGVLPADDGAVWVVKRGLGGSVKKGFAFKDRLVDGLSWYGFVDIDMLRGGKEE
ncbi:hypothetical protein PG997_014359 [Apiospora hydei]|uniref:Uncharacterized protein n=1 Tax=Apiospora hydei TaxID=1337664 RepID=A0ABR1UTP1_9PEZI